MGKGQGGGVVVYQLVSTRCDVSLNTLSVSQMYCPPVERYRSAPFQPLKLIFPPHVCCIVCIIVYCRESLNTVCCTASSPCVAQCTLVWHTRLFHSHSNRPSPCIVPTPCVVPRYFAVPRCWDPSLSSAGCVREQAAAMHMLLGLCVYALGYLPSGMSPISCL